MARMPEDLRKILQKQEDDIDKLLTETKNKFYEVARKNSTNPNRLAEMASYIMLSFITAYTYILTQTNLKVVQAAGKKSKSELNSMLYRIGIKNNVLVAQFNKEVNGIISKYGVKAILKRKIGKNTIEYHIKTIYNGSVKTVRNIVAVGVSKGKSAIDIAKQIEQYIRPTERLTRISPFEWYRKRFASYKVKNLKQIPPGSVSYNAFRIARSETARTYQDYLVKMNQDKPWVYGFKWNLSASHPFPDICDVWAEKDYGMGAGVYNADNLPIDHPNGMCYVTTVQVAPKDFKNYLKTGKKPYKPKFKGKVPDLDDWNKAKKGTSPQSAIRKLK